MNSFESPVASTSEETLPSEEELERSRKRFEEDIAKKSEELGIPPEERMDYVHSYALHQAADRKELEDQGEEGIKERDAIFGQHESLPGKIKGRELHARVALEHISAKLEQQKEFATRDQLTGLLNRHGFYDEIEKLQKEIRDTRDQQKTRTSDRRQEHAEKTPPYYTVLFFDADHFKRVNDTYGHATGDTVLKKISEVLQKNVRTSEGFVARFGGEELIVVLRADINVACAVAERIRSDIQNIRFPVGDKEDSTFSVTVSIGIAPYEEDVEQQVGTADTAVYAAKGDIGFAEKGMRERGGSIVVPKEPPLPRNQIWFVQKGILSKYDPKTPKK